MEIVINSCFGGFGLSYKAVMRYAELSGFKLYASQIARDKDGNLVNGLSKYTAYDGTGERPFIISYNKKPLKSDGTHAEDTYFSCGDIERNDPLLVQVVKELKEDAGGRYASLEVVEIPDDIEWEIEEYDGNEHISERHKIWR